MIVPTHNRAALLDDALSTLAAQEGPLPGWEIVVVDDGCTDDTPAVVDRHAARGLPVRRVHQPNAGLNAARNRGAEETQGDVLAYLDDDVLVPPGWARALTEAFAAHPDAAGAGGPVRLRFEAPPPPWLGPRLHQFLSALDGPAEPGWLGPGRHPVGANFALTRAWWEKLGGFRAGLDRRGQSLVSNGEVELFGRIARAGGRLWWCPQAWVLHRVPPTRMTKDWFLARALAQGQSDALVRPSPRWRELVRLARAVPILVRGGLDERARLHAGLWARYCWGRLRGREATT